MVKYTVKDGKVAQSNPFCPRCGAGVFLADQGDWWSCGKCGTRWAKASFGTQPAEVHGRTNADHGRAARNVTL